MGAPWRPEGGCLSSHTHTHFHFRRPSERQSPRARSPWDVRPDEKAKAGAPPTASGRKVVPRGTAGKCSVPGDSGPRVPRPVGGGRRYLPAGPRRPQKKKPGRIRGAQCRQVVRAGRPPRWVYLAGFSPVGRRAGDAGDEPLAAVSSQLSRGTQRLGARVAEEGCPGAGLAASGPRAYDVGCRVACVRAHVGLAGVRAV